MADRLIEKLFVVVVAYFGVVFAVVMVVQGLSKKTSAGGGQKLKHLAADGTNVTKELKGA